MDSGNTFYQDRSLEVQLGSDNFGQCCRSVLCMGPDNFGQCHKVVVRLGSDNFGQSHTLEFVKRRTTPTQPELRRISW